MIGVAGLSEAGPIPATQHPVHNLDSRQHMQIVSRFCMDPNGGFVRRALDLRAHRLASTANDPRVRRADGL